MEPFVSVIVPAYNAEKTLCDTVGDILSQTYTDFELILVDDGSTDQTAAICDEYASADKRVRVIHQQNGGPSNARNNGVKIARGKYVSFIDSDDRVESEYLDYLIRAVTECRADIAFGVADRLNEKTDQRIYRVLTLDTKETVRHLLIGKYFGVGPWCRLVPREWYVQNPFLEGAYYEDLSNTYKLCLKAQKTAVVDTVLYHYIRRAGAITARKVITHEQCVDYYNAITACTEAIYEKYPDLEDEIALLKAHNYLSLYLSINRCEEKSEELDRIKREVIAWIRRNWARVLLNSSIALEPRLRPLLFSISPSLYEKIYYIAIKMRGKSLA